LESQLKIRTTLRVVAALITLIAWWITLSQTGQMGLLMRLGVPMSLSMEGRANASSFVLFTAMWSVMMVAMMLPSSYPTLLLHRTVSLQRKNPAPGTFLFAVSYFLVWSATGVFFYGAYLLIGYWRSSAMISDTLILRASGVALIIAGVYQWSQLKFTCLQQCQSPLHFIMEHWREGNWGAVHMGAKHGYYCFGCCWGLMLVLFVMGVMHIGWMAAVGAFILLEKTAPSMRWLPRLGGLGMVATGVAILIAPDTLASFSSHVTLG
jgi:predicted metal-binding membrane protein